jgi:hypothetical protein
MSADKNYCEWKGASGRAYGYWFYEIPHEFQTVDGNYILCKLVNNQWVPIYFGQGNLGERVGESHHKWDCAMKKGATHVLVHTNQNEAARLAEEKDLLAIYTQAYAPTGCNEREGG